MAAAVLTRTVRVLDYEGDLGQDRVRFSRPPDEPGDLPTIVSLDRDTWEDFDRPEKITITIEPGDLLNT